MLCLIYLAEDFISIVINFINTDICADDGFKLLVIKAKLPFLTCLRVHKREYM